MMRSHFAAQNLLWASAFCLFAFSMRSDGTANMRYTVEAKEVVTRYAPADNGAGPLWCYGSTVIARQGSDVYLSVIETGEGVPELLAAIRRPAASDAPRSPALLSPDPSAV